MAVLIALSGLPGVGKTTIAQALAPLVDAMHLRVDSIEAALRSSMLGIHPAQDAGYLAVAAVARDNLKLGHHVIADTVNPLGITRRLWTETAAEAGVPLLNVEVICSDKTQHRSQVEQRQSDIAGLELPDWDRVASREFEPWRDDRVIIDTSHQSAQQAAEAIAKHVEQLHNARV